MRKSNRALEALRRAVARGVAEHGAITEQREAMIDKNTPLTWDLLTEHGERGKAARAELDRRLATLQLQPAEYQRGQALYERAQKESEQ